LPGHGRVRGGGEWKEGGGAGRCGAGGRGVAFFVGKETREKKNKRLHTHPTGPPPLARPKHAHSTPHHSAQLVADDVHDDLRGKGVGRWGAHAPEGGREGPGAGWPRPRPRRAAGSE
jgi:hypothetical protein